MSKAEKVRIAQIIATLRIEPEFDPAGENIDAIYGGPITARDITEFVNGDFEGYAEGMLAGLADLAEVIPARDWLRVWKLHEQLTEGASDWGYWEQLAA